MLVKLRGSFTWGVRCFNGKSHILKGLNLSVRCCKEQGNCEPWERIGWVSLASLGKRFVQKTRGSLLKIHS